MPFALVVIGLLMVIAAYNNTQSLLAAQLKEDLTGTGGFIYWIAALLIIGAIGYVKPLETASRMMLLLLLIVFFLANGGVFAKFNEALAGSGTPSKVSGA